MQNQRKQKSGKSNGSRCRACELTEFFCEKCLENLNSKIPSNSTPRPVSIVKETSPSNFVKIAQNDVFGKHLVAARDISAGTVIWTEDALVTAPMYAEQLIAGNVYPCVGCYRITPRHGLRKCSNCDWLVCSKECAKVPEHMNNECRCKAPFDRIGPFSALAYRITMLKTRAPSKFARVFQLSSNLSPKIDTRKVRMVDSLKNFQLQAEMRLLKIDSSVTLEIYREIFHIMKLNSIGLSIYHAEGQAHSINDQRLGLGLYDYASLMVHSCVPNCGVEIEFPPSNKLRVNAAVDIKKGEPLTRFYRERFTANPYGGVAERQATLQQREDDNSTPTSILCKCPLCSDPFEMGTNLSTIICTKCNTPSIVPVNPTAQAYKNFDKWEWACQNKGCKEKMKKSDLKKMDEEILSITRRIPINETELDICSHRWAKVKTFEKKVHPNYWAIVTAAKELCRQYCQIYAPPLATPDFKHHEEIMEYLLSVLDVIRPGLNPERAILLHRLAFANYVRILGEDLQKIQSHLVTFDDMELALTKLKKIMEMEKEALKYFSLNKNSEMRKVAESTVKEAEKLEGQLRIALEIRNLTIA